MFIQSLRNTINCTLLCVAVMVANSSFGEIDQASRTDPSLSDPISFVQTFTAGSSSQLIGVWLYMQGKYTLTSDDTWTVELLRFNGNTLGNLLAMGSFVEYTLNTEYAEWRYIEFEIPYDQYDGEEYALRVSSSGEFGQSGGWVNFGVYANLDSYSGGAAYRESSSSGALSLINSGKTDYLFQTVINNNNGMALDIEIPSTIKVAVRNRFESGQTTPIHAYNATTFESFTFRDGSSVTILGASGEIWQFYVDITEPRRTGYTTTLADLGYSESDTINVAMPETGSVERTLYVKNTSKRTMPTLDLSVTMLSDGDLYLGGDVKIRTIEAETKYIVQYSEDLSINGWNNMDIYTAQSDKGYQSIYPNYWERRFTSKRFFRVVVEAPSE